MEDVKCLICNKEEKVAPSRAKNYKCCCKKCYSIYRKNKTIKNCICTQCNKKFHLKESQLKRYNRRLGTFCSQKCCTEYKKSFYKGKKNPNYRGKIVDNDGYLITYTEKKGRINLHKLVVFNFLKINKIPKGFQIHHRDCDKYNNTEDNLVLLSLSDHRWLHKQFGNATLWAYMHNKIDLDSLIEWSTEKDKARKLLQLSIKDQTGVFKSDELLENPEVDNQQPS